MTAPASLNLKQVARRLRLTVTTVHRLVHRGEINATIVAGHFEVAADEVDAYIERSRIAPGSLRIIEREQAAAS